MGTSSSKGNSGISSDHADLSRLARQAEAIERNAEKWATHNGNKGSAVLSIAIYPPRNQRDGSWLLVAKGFDGGVRLVSFKRGASILTVLSSFLSGLVRGDLVWKPDDYADKPTLKGG